MKCIRVRVHGSSRVTAVTSAIILKEYLAELVKGPIVVVEDHHVGVPDAYEMIIYIGGNLLTRWYWWWRVKRTLKYPRWAETVEVLYSV